METPLDPTKEDGYYAVYHKQKSEYLMNQLNWFKAHGSYNIQRVISVEILDLRALRDALQALVDRHEALRATFACVEGEIKQKITRRVEVPIGEVRLGQEDGEEKVQAVLDGEQKQFFDFNRGPLFKVVVIHLPNHTYLLVFTINHVISDGWSLDVIHRELLTLYQACAGGQPVRPEPLTVQARHFADWENRVLDGEWGSKCRAYWHSRLGRDLPVHYLADLYKQELAVRSTLYREVLAKEVETYFPQLLDQPYYPTVFGTLHRVVTHRGAAYRFVIGSGLLGRLERLAAQSWATVFRCVLASCYALLYKLTRKKDIMIGIPIAVRDREEWENVLGWLMNVLLIREEVDESLSFAGFMRSLNHTFNEAYSYKVYPMERILNELDVSLDAIGCLHVNYLDYNKHNSLGDTEAGHIDDLVFPFFDIDFHLNKYSNAIDVMCVYKSELFTPGTIEFICTEYLHLLERICENPSLTLRELAGSGRPVPATVSVVEKDGVSFD